MIHQSKPWKVHVTVAGVPGPPLVIPVPVPTAREALDRVKGSMREVLGSTYGAGATEYTASVFPSGYRAGDESVLAEKVTLVAISKL
jgi:hypothetical protein